METITVTRLSDMLGNAANSLQALCNGAGDAPHLHVSTVVRLAAKLTAIQTNLAHIRRFMSTPNNPEKTPRVPCERLYVDLDLCVTSGRVLVDSLDAVVLAINTGAVQAENESDWESVNVGQNFKHHTHDPTSVFYPYFDRLDAGFEIVLRAVSFTRWSDQQALLGSTSSRKILQELEQDRLDFTSAKPCGDRIPSSSPRPGGCSSPPSWSSRLGLGRGLSTLSFLFPAYARLFTGLLAEGGDQRPRKDSPRQEMHQAVVRVSSWPLMKQLDRRVSERAAREAARKRSAFIDKQIETDFYTWRKCSVLMWGSYESKMLLVQHFMAAGVPSGAGADLMTDVSSAVMQIRRDALLEARRVVEGVVRCQMNIGEEAMACAKHLLQQMDEDDAVLDMEIARAVEELWSLPTLRAECVRAGRPEAHDNQVMDAVRRVAAPNYTPTTADYRRAIVDRKWEPIRGVFDIGSLSMSVLDHEKIRIRCCAARRMAVDNFFDNTTSLVFIVDLAKYDEPLPFYHDTPARPQLEFTYLLDLFDGLVNRSKSFPNASMILLFSNVGVFGEKIRRHTPLSRVFSDYRGRHGNVEDAIGYIVGRFTSLDTGRGKWIYPHVGELMDASTMAFLLEAVKDTMLNCSLREAGLFQG
ncbi:G-protein alpha subunit-domain-containing protein [Podospora appendiculata]|uniref:G-protein alpha subunit-domain-containing protein n=1 Tax=Podospora appendiculata TaxID=314037 RepID=A0AAE0X8G9_9PEZI|nr:G-protein alpha subunit-domain-containing protein [Podospora appendiculata]